MIAALNSSQSEALGWASGLVALWLSGLAGHVAYKIGLWCEGYNPKKDMPPFLSGLLVGLLPSVAAGITVWAVLS